MPNRSLGKTYSSDLSFLMMSMFLLSLNKLKIEADDPNFVPNESTISDIITKLKANIEKLKENPHELNTKEKYKKSAMLPEITLFLLFFFCRRNLIRSDTSKKTEYCSFFLFSFSPCCKTEDESPSLS